MQIVVGSATRAFEQVLAKLRGAQECAPRGLAIKELIDCNIEITNPLDRIIQTPDRKTNVSYAFGELLWYLSGRNDLKTIGYYSTRMVSFSDDGLTLNSAYGYRIFGHHPMIGFDQWAHVKKLLTEDPDSRQAIIHLHTPNDKKTKDEVCTLSLQFLIRAGKLQMITTMRSNDIVLGFTYDVFSFTMLQEMMAYELKVEIGSYFHKVGSMHIYERDFNLLDAPNLSGPTFPMLPIGGGVDYFKGFLPYEESARGAGKDYVDFVKHRYTLLALSDLPRDPSYEFVIAALNLWAIRKRSDMNKYDDVCRFYDAYDAIINYMRLMHEGYADILSNYIVPTPRGNFKIIVDGIDASGKSTFINKLRDHLRKNLYFANVHHYDVPTEYFDFENDYLKSLKLKTDVIYDRFFVSELAYHRDAHRIDPIIEGMLFGECVKPNVITVTFAFSDSDIENAVYPRMKAEDKTSSTMKEIVERNKVYLKAHDTFSALGDDFNTFLVNDPEFDVEKLVWQVVDRVIEIKEASKNARSSSAR